MPLCPLSEKCKEQWVMDTTYRTKQYRFRCKNCGFAGDWCSNPIIAHVSTYSKEFNGERDFNKENSMSQTYEQGYKRGVTDALDLGFGFAGSYTEKYLKEQLDAQRKRLLTKKVTKYVAVGISPANSKPYAQGYFQDTEASALALKTGDPMDSSFIGIFPIEIEVEL